MRVPCLACGARRICRCNPYTRYGKHQGALLRGRVRRASIKKRMGSGAVFGIILILAYNGKIFASCRLNVTHQAQKTLRRVLCRRTEGRACSRGVNTVYNEQCVPIHIYSSINTNDNNKFAKRVLFPRFFSPLPFFHVVCIPLPTVEEEEEEEEEEDDDDDDDDAADGWPSRALILSQHTPQYAISFQHCEWGGMGWGQDDYTRTRSLNDKSRKCCSSLRARARSHNIKRFPGIRRTIILYIPSHRTYRFFLVLISLQALLDGAGEFPRGRGEGQEWGEGEDDSA